MSLAAFTRKILYQLALKPPATGISYHAAQGCFRDGAACLPVDSREQGPAFCLLCLGPEGVARLGRRRG
jgi:hypothetical protein